MSIVSLSSIESEAPGLLRNSIDERIVKIRPMSTPIDQISRCGGCRNADSMTVEYYTVDAKGAETTVTEKMDAEALTESNGIYEVELSVADGKIFEPTETVLLPEVMGSSTTGVDSPLMLYVMSSGRSSIVCAVVNPLHLSGGAGMPEVPEGAKVVRMGRAATELDVQTPQFASIPKKASNNCQIFKMQVEQTTLAKIAAKEVGWNFSDQEEAAIIDMRLGMEKNFLFGSAAKLYDPEKKHEVYLTGGIWQQAQRSHGLTLASLTEADVIALCANAFTGNNGSKRKILVAGTALMTALSNLSYTKSVSAGETLVRWGIELREIATNFGRLYVVHSEVFDQCCHEKDGFILDPDYLTKYVHVPFNAQTLNLSSAGVRNTDAVVLTEASCLVLRYPEAHIRVIGR